VHQHGVAGRQAERAQVFPYRSADLGLIGHITL
jgi:hypothetical protein